MKIQPLFLILICALLSCDKNDDGVTVEQWKLIEMTGSFTNSVTTGDAMEWQETYELKSDGSFRKIRDLDGVITEASGLYHYMDDANENLLELNFISENDIIGSCISGTKEIMTIQSETTFFNSWNACDGPGLLYEKIED